MTQITNPFGWIEIAVTDMPRAMKFYEDVFGVKLHRMELGPLEMAMWPELPGGKGAGGALVKHAEWYKPTTDGALIYFTAQSGDLKNEVSRVEVAGGQVVVPIKQISPDYGWMACCTDTEGNRFAIHSREHAA